jgi:hypothetical protein
MERNRNMQKRSMRLRLIALAVLATLAVAAGTARADTVRVSQGDAQAVLEAFGNGGWAILRHSDSVVLGTGTPADGLRDSLAAIRPFAFVNGNHYCALDWHVILVAIFDGGDASYTVQDFAAYRSQVSMAFTLDGQPLATDRTASKRTLRDLTSFGVTTAYYFQQGRVLAPEELAVGTHTLAWVISAPEGAASVTIAFTVDAPGTGTCL